MQDVFEPMANFGGEVFEPTANFKGESSGGGNSSGNADMIMAGVGAGLDFGKSLMDSRAKKKEAEAKLKASQTAREREKSECDKIKFFADPKKTRNRRISCKEEVDKRYNKEESEQRDILKQQIDLEKSKVSLQKSAQDDSKKSKEEESKKKRNLIIGLSIGGGVLVLGTILFFVLRKK